MVCSDGDHDYRLPMVCQIVVNDTVEICTDEPMKKRWVDRSNISVNGRPINQNLIRLRGLNVFLDQGDGRKQKWTPISFAQTGLASTYRNDRGLSVSHKRSCSKWSIDLITMKCVCVRPTKINPKSKWKSIYSRGLQWQSREEAYNDENCSSKRRTSRHSFKSCYTLPQM